jgi:hypothetical protein
MTIKNRNEYRNSEGVRKNRKKERKREKSETNEERMT